MSSENRISNAALNTRSSFKDSTYKNPKLSIIKDEAESEFLNRQVKRKTTMEAKRLRNLRLNKISK